MTPVAVALRVLIRAYQIMVSPFFPACCRYWPSCSAYAAQAVRRHGAVVGSWLAVRRIARCHPWGGYGYDPVPERCCAGSCDDMAAAEKMERGV